MVHICFCLISQKNCYTKRSTQIQWFHIYKHTVKMYCVYYLVLLSQCNGIVEIKTIANIQ